MPVGPPGGKMTRGASTPLALTGMLAAGCGPKSSGGDSAATPPAPPAGFLTILAVNPAPWTGHAAPLICTRTIESQGTQNVTADWTVISGPGSLNLATGEEVEVRSGV